MVPGLEGHINVFEDLTGLDAENAIALDEVVAFASGVLPTKSVGESEAGGELFGINDEAGAVGGPWNGCFHGLSVLGSQFSAIAVD